MNANYGKQANAKRDAARIGIGIGSCRKLLAQIGKAKDAILAEFRGTLETQEHLLHLALNEAEAVAWQTGYPQLVFPTLAAEKVQAVAEWQARQQFIRRTGPNPELAARRNDGY